MKLNKLTALVITGALLSTLFMVGCAPKEGGDGTTGEAATTGNATTPNTETPPADK